MDDFHEGLAAHVLALEVLESVSSLLKCRCFVFAGSDHCNTFGFVHVLLMLWRLSQYVNLMGR